MLRPAALVAVAALFCVAAPAAAQDTAPPSVIRAPTPVVQPASTLAPGFETRSESILAPSSALQPTRGNRALMIVGGAGLIVGAIIGGDEGTIIMVGSGLIGLYGLYLYMR